MSIPKLHNSLQFVNEEIWNKKWPELVDISLSDTWGWLTKKLYYSLEIGDTPANSVLLKAFLLHQCVC